MRDPPIDVQCWLEEEEHERKAGVTQQHLGNNSCDNGKNT